VANGPPSRLYAKACTVQSALVGELRADFRAVRVDRIAAIEFLPKRYPRSRVDVSWIISPRSATGGW
jgi:hypothetical protein